MFPAAVTKLAGKTVSVGKVAADAKIDPSLLTKDGHIDVSDYRQAPEPSYRYKQVDTNKDGEGIFERRPDLIHPDFADRIAAFDQTSWFRETPVVNALLKTSMVAKKSLLSLSPFHWTTEYLRGLQLGLSPWEAFHPPPLDENRLAVTEGTNTGWYCSEIETLRIWPLKAWPRIPRFSNVSASFPVLGVRWMLCWCGRKINYSKTTSRD
jgi:hypothetical protein